ncbi:hypothetical protein TWF569_006535 [Orbilia oligospora]|uniref:Uncharacterized protein n=1 Tax=Orbilia oligospora TaxID=2813651 RepID=A0A7C8IZV7_ORBOL|nr:hypothetical protein TWF102_002914 [Orbilia oligospora]KAF3103270.1 hypothetical protein TWF103_007263 [Orbilia oligospora]KAF3105683.1 hypothetical protein TWF706_003786 [Orbilia oligospora]KAF3127530.1 hypothetical protein TWF594_000656 [Orbilia oligospora]KAF3145994.1 hypothetical protein TWF569_006535 [Orbilia oligospora]
MGRISRLFSFKPPKFSIPSISTFTTIISGPKLKIKKKLSISPPQLDPIYHPYRDFSNTVTGTGTGTTGTTGPTINGGFYDQISIHGYAVPARFIAAEHTAIFLDTLPIGDFKRLGQLVITASVGRLGHLSLLPDSDHLIMVAVTKLKGISRDSYVMDNELRLRLIYFLVNRYGAYFRCLNQLYPGELESLVGGSHRCHPLAVL